MPTFAAMGRIKDSLKGGNALAWAAAVAVVAIWGETFVSSKIVLAAGFEPAEIFFYRFIIAYAGMWTLSHRRLWAGSLRDEMMLIALGISGGSVYFLAENTALVYSTASNVAILVASTPLVTALLLSLFYKDERMSRRQLTGSLAAFAGMILVVLNGNLVLHLNPLGDLLALAASLTWGCYSLIIKRLSGRYDTSFITRKVFGYGLLSILPVMATAGGPMIRLDAIVAGGVAVWGNLLYLGVVASLLCFLAWNWALTKLGTVRTTNILYMQAFFTMLVGHLVLNERITLMAVAGAVILILGMSRAVEK